MSRESFVISESRNNKPLERSQKRFSSATVASSINLRRPFDLMEVTTDEPWRKPGRCSSCGLFKSDFGEAPDFYGHCKMYQRSGSRQGSNFACDQYEPMAGFDALTRSADHDRHFTDPALIGKKPDKKTKTIRRASRSSGTTRRSTAKPKAPSVAEVLTTWRTLIGSRTLDDAKKYDVRASYELHDLVDHSKFDLGVVVETVGHNKVKVLFRTGERILITRYGQS